MGPYDDWYKATFGKRRVTNAEELSKILEIYLKGESIGEPDSFHDSILFHCIMTAIEIAIPLSYSKSNIGAAMDGEIALFALSRYTSLAKTDYSNLKKVILTDVYPDPGDGVRMIRLIRLALNESVSVPDLAETCKTATEQMVQYLGLNTLMPLSDNDAIGTALRICDDRFRRINESMRPGVIEEILTSRATNTSERRAVIYLAKSIVEHKAMWRYFKPDIASALENMEIDIMPSPSEIRPTKADVRASVSRLMDELRLLPY
jgi:hypothetical protein